MIFVYICRNLCALIQNERSIKLFFHNLNALEAGENMWSCFTILTCTTPTFWKIAIDDFFWILEPSHSREKNHLNFQYTEHFINKVGVLISIRSFVFNMVWHIITFNISYAHTHCLTHWWYNKQSIEGYKIRLE